MTHVAKKAPNPAVKRAIDAYHARFTERFGFKPVIHGGKDGQHFAKLLATWDEPTVQWLIGEFFATTDPRVVRCDYTVGALFNLAQHLLLRREGQHFDERTAKNIDAAARATARK